MADEILRPARVLGTGWDQGSKVVSVNELPVLGAEDQRILGSLLEKQATVPAAYPLTANALRAACNQTSNREPVVDLDQQTVEQTARALKDRGLLRIVWSDTGRRTLKYHQILDERLGLDPEERALLTVLLLRGAQAPGELRTRTERLHGFDTRGDVEACLRRMAERPQPLVRELERRPGQQDPRWAHLLGPSPQQPAEPVTVDREAVIAEGADLRDALVRSSYDAVATFYADHLVDELRGLPFESWLLDRMLDHVGGQPVVEVGSGPGHVTAYLADRGADATGIDLSPAMVNEARRRFPGRSFEVGDLRRLSRPAASPGWAAVLGWYSLIHLAPSELPDAARRFRTLTKEALEHRKAILAIVRSWRPDLLEQLGVGPIVAATVLCAWSHPGRIHSEAAFAMLAGVAPIPANSGQVTNRYRLNHYGDRQLNRALHTVVQSRIRYHDTTRAYVARRTTEGKTGREIKRCLSRYIARDLYRLLESGPTSA